MSMLGPTNNHDTIRQWAVIHGAMPVAVETKKHDGEPTKLGFVFANGRRVPPDFKPISWDNFFAIFDLLELSLVYDEHRQNYELLQPGTSLDNLGYGVGQN